MEKVRGDWVKRTCCRMAGEEKFGYFRLGEGTEGEDGSFEQWMWLVGGPVCGVENWLPIVLVLSVKKVAKSVSCHRSGGRWWRGTEERIKCSEEITHVWSAVDLVVEV